MSRPQDLHRPGALLAVGTGRMLDKLTPLMGTGRHADRFSDARLLLAGQMPFVLDDLNVRAAVVELLFAEIDVHQKCARAIGTHAAGRPAEFDDWSVLPAYLNEVQLSNVLPVDEEARNGAWRYQQACLDRLRRGQPGPPRLTPAQVRSWQVDLTAVELHQAICDRAALAVSTSADQLALIRDRLLTFGTAPADQPHVDLLDRN